MPSMQVCSFAGRGLLACLLQHRLHMFDGEQQAENAQVDCRGVKAVDRRQRMWRWHTCLLEQ